MSDQVTIHSMTHLGFSSWWNSRNKCLNIHEFGPLEYATDIKSSVELLELQWDEATLGGKFR
jgi:hypothetical protein